jgi:catechol 2,3-dioxygenase-like lactoylglutathione lyase family enzyme
MGVHHIGLATKDNEATHRFYTEVMGFQLVKVMAIPWPGGPPGSWARHSFYRTGEGGDAGMIAFWELHNPEIGDRFRTDVSTCHGLPNWVNHLAFEAPTEEALSAHLARWLGCGLRVSEMDPGFCKSIYTTDPNGILVEFCWTTRPFTEEEVGEAERLLRDPAPRFEPSGKMIVHQPEERP